MIVSADPPDGGEVEADPVYEPGELAKLKAKPHPGWCFVNWTQNGVAVSTDPNYHSTSPAIANWWATSRSATALTPASIRHRRHRHRRRRICRGRNRNGRGDRQPRLCLPQLD